MPRRTPLRKTQIQQAVSHSWPCRTALRLVQTFVNSISKLILCVFHTLGMWFCWLNFFDSYYTKICICLHCSFQFVNIYWSYIGFFINVLNHGLLKQNFIQRHGLDVKQWYILIHKKNRKTKMLMYSLCCTCVLFQMWRLNPL